jgi:hypothetical protein
MLTAIAVGLLATTFATVDVELGVAPAEAIVGRPLTPVSYAGVARRTTRRTVSRTAYATGATTGVVTALPSGCGQTAAGGTVYYQCGGGAYYRPYYQGATVVYQSVPGP